MVVRRSLRKVTLSQTWPPEGASRQRPRERVAQAGPTARTKALELPQPMEREGGEERTTGGRGGSSGELASLFEVIRTVGLGLTEGFPSATLGPPQSL